MNNILGMIVLKSVKLIYHGLLPTFMLNCLGITCRNWNRWKSSIKGYRRKSIPIRRMREWQGIRIESSSITKSIVWTRLNVESRSWRDKIRHRCSCTNLGMNCLGVEKKSSKHGKTSIPSTNATWVENKYWFSKKIIWRDIENLLKHESEQT